MAALTVRVSPLESRTISLLCRPRERRRPWVCGDCRIRQLSGYASRSESKQPKHDSSRRQSSIGTVGAPVKSLHTSSKFFDQYSASAGATLDQVGPWGNNWSQDLDQEDAGDVESQRDTPYGDTSTSWRRNNTQEASLFTPSRAYRSESEVALEQAAAQESAIDHSGTSTEVKRNITLGTTDRLVKILLDEDGVVMVSDELFTDALALICSKNVFGDLVRKHGITSGTQAHLMRVTPMQEVIVDYLRVIDGLVSKRRAIGQKLSSQDYGQVLAASHFVGNDEAARRYWSYMVEDQTAPDMACFNNFLGAHVWNDTLPQFRTRSRVTSFNMMARDNFYAGAPYNNYKIRESGVKELTTKVFGELLKHKYQADEETICHVMVGLAREGDVKGFQKMLSRVWDIDPDRIMREDDRAPKKTIDPNSSLYPTQRLLYNISFCYSLNNDLPTGLRVIDYISRHFDIAVTDVVWDSLLHWAYVLSRPKPKDSSDPATLDLDAVYRVWDTMQMAPYEVKPTLSMYDALIKTYWKASRYNDMMATMNEAWTAFADLSENYKQAWTKLEKCTTGELDQQAVERAQREVDEIGFMTKWGSIALKQWVKLLLSASRSVNKQVGSPEGEQFSQIDIPAMLGSGWSHFFPQYVGYYLPTGHVTMKTMTGGDLVAEHAKKMKTNNRRKRVMDRAERALGHDWVHRSYTNRRLEKAGLLNLM
ncbi:putative mitochondrial ATPase expression protein [Elsinoe australis]|uniref:Putative mitochondrial ATPase expression protein n=1 Tax=Elsinoe australis TaxID=40998 RepID=A0A4U7B6K8_9PEZI|nr:putative mitochondrial ATPase expression protein [Elsinoe australis]